MPESLTDHEQYVMARALQLLRASYTVFRREFSDGAAVSFAAAAGDFVAEAFIDAPDEWVDEWWEIVRARRKTLQEAHPRVGLDAGLFETDS